MESRCLKDIVGEGLWQVDTAIVSTVDEEEWSWLHIVVVGIARE